MPRSVNIWGIAIGAAACIFGTAAAFAQDTPARVRGTLDKMDGNNLTIQTRSGKEATVTLKDGAPVVAVTKGAMSDIKSNTFVGITAMAQSDGTIKAVEVHVFEESGSGSGWASNVQTKTLCPPNVGSGWMPSDLFGTRTRVRGKKALRL